jgi:hypothetical protein
VVYETVHILTGFHADLVVEVAVIVEIKALKRIAPVHKKQLLTYLKVADKRKARQIRTMAFCDRPFSPAIRDHIRCGCLLLRRSHQPKDHDSLVYLSSYND